MLQACEHCFLDRDVVKFGDQFIDELKARLRLSDVIGKTVKLRRQGREYVGLSPFTKERTPSFYVNDDKGFFHDFSSGKHGDLISFFQETERLSFVEAVERLASEAGVAVPAPDPRAAARDQERQSQVSWIEQASLWFESELRRPVGREARSYLQKRGLGEDLWPRFRVGYAPAARTALKDYLISKGARIADLVTLGLLIAPDDGTAPYDRFRDRIIFPIADERGRLISFGGRALSPDARAKYINGPDTPLFDKGRVLYGYSEARRLLREAKDDPPFVVVEGYMDVIACQRAGIPAVAPMGTSLTEDQIELLWRAYREPTLCFDGDRAGRLAAGRAIDRLLPLLKSDHTVRFATISGGKDADDVFREHGAEALRGQLTNSVGFADALFRREFDAEPLDTPERRASLKGRLRRTAGSITDRDLSEQFRNHLLDAFYSFFGRKRLNDSETRRDFVDGFKGTLARRSELPNILDRIRTLNAAVAVAAVWHPTWLASFVEEFIGFGDKHLAELVQPLLDTLQEKQPSAELVMQNIKSDGATYAYERALHFVQEAGGYPFVIPGDEGERFHQVWLECFHAVRELWAIEEELKERHKTHEEELKRPVDDRRAPVDPAYHINRGIWLRKHELELGRLIHSGELWSAKALSH
ncbi:MAG TPA: DNA primase [Caulobacteraceae bacterium]|jgi:DNA primase